MNDETNSQIFFINGVKVFINNEHNRTIGGNGQAAAQHLSAIATLLGHGWTVEINGDNFIALHKNGGYEAGGYTIWGHSQQSNVQHPDYWKYNLSGRLPQPPTHSDRFSKDSPRITTSIANTKNFIRQINKILPEIIELTDAARAHVLKIADRDVLFDQMRREVSGVMKCKPREWQAHDRRFEDSYLYNENGSWYTAKVYAGGSVSVDLHNLTLAKFKAVMSIMIASE